MEVKKVTTEIAEGNGKAAYHQVYEYVTYRLSA